MNSPINRRLMGVAPWILAAGLALAAPIAYADDPVSMAPPVSADSPMSTDADIDDATIDNNASADTVFQWNEVPARQQVPITRAVFDHGGYQLYDNVGETIVVPFTNDNLYVMKFAVSDTGDMYFVNEGDAPVLYVPSNGYLENATVPGARWYPFTKDFQPSDPVYLGIAPSWNAYVGMGWYPDMWCWGGYYGDTPFINGGIFVPCDGFEIVIGSGAPFFGWSAYHNWYYYHPAPYHLGWYNRNNYSWARRPIGPGHEFSGWSGGRGGGGWSGAWNGHSANRPISPSTSWNRGGSRQSGNYSTRQFRGAGGNWGSSGRSYSSTRTYSGSGWNGGSQRLFSGSWTGRSSGGSTGWNGGFRSGGGSFRSGGGGSFRSFGGGGFRGGGRNGGFRSGGGGGRNR